MSQPGYWQLREAVERDARLFRDFAASCRLRNPGQAWLMLKRVEALEKLLNAAPAISPPSVSAGARAAESQGERCVKYPDRRS